MCGRFALTAPYAELQTTFALNGSVVWKPKYNIAPGQYLVAIKEWGKLDFLMWGLVPGWMQAKNQLDSKPSAGIINARVETIADKPAFRNSVDQRRCLVLANGYYEWKQEDRKKQPYYISPKNGRVCCFAGIWDGDTCALITAESGTDTSFVHTRRPIIVPEHNYQLWLNKKKKFVDIAADIIAASDIELAIYPVTPKVNSPAFDTDICIQPLA